jgi:hypothetical protein
MLVTVYRDHKLRAICNLLQLIHTSLLKKFVATAEQVAK